jgi:hypothetical protein
MKRKKKNKTPAFSVYNTLNFPIAYICVNLNAHVISVVEKIFAFNKISLMIYLSLSLLHDF